MNKKILRYRLPFQTEARLNLPAGAEILKLHEQHGDVFLYALVDAGSDSEASELEFEPEMRMRSFIVVGAGGVIHNFDDGYRYVGTFHQGGGVMSYHVFERLT